MSSKSGGKADVAALRICATSAPALLRLAKVVHDSETVQISSIIAILSRMIRDGEIANRDGSNDYGMCLRHMLVRVRNVALAPRQAGRRRVR